jgi:heme/copper-type cytochrome/quinol oxidase subunit 2
VKTVQKLLFGACFCHNVILIKVNIDVRLVWGLYNPVVLLALTFLIIFCPVIGTILWLREISKVNARSAHVSHRAKAELLGKLLQL